MSGTKFDAGKADLSLIPYSAQVAEAQGFMDGLTKYGRHQYMGGMESHRLVAACLRHVLAWQAGEEVAEDSGVHHLGHARCCLSMLIELQRIGRLTDTRYLESAKGLQPPQQFSGGLNTQESLDAMERLIGGQCE